MNAFPHATRFLLLALLLAACGDDGPAAAEPTDQDPAGSSAASDASTNLDAARPNSDDARAAVADSGRDSPANSGELDAGELDASPATEVELDAAASDAALPSADAATPVPTDAAAPADAHTTQDAAALEDAGEGDAGEVECLQLGESCAAVGSCCDGSTCVSDSNSGLAVCIPVCTNNDDCESGCCTTVGELKLCAAADECEPPPPPGCLTAELRADDGTYLGLASSSTFLPDSVCNEQGSYGNDSSQTSIYNPFGSYGSTFNPLSAYNLSASKPPKIVCKGSGALVVYVSMNAAKSPRVDPEELCSVLADQGL